MSLPLIAVGCRIGASILWSRHYDYVSTSLLVSSVVLVGRVRLHVRPQIRAIGERLAAMSATIRFLASMAA
jgi:hypothetical protein